MLFGVLFASKSRYSTFRNMSMASANASDIPTVSYLDNHTPNLLWTPLASVSIFQSTHVEGGVNVDVQLPVLQPLSQLLKIGPCGMTLNKTNALLGQRKAGSQKRPNHAKGGQRGVIRASSGSDNPQGSTRRVQCWRIEDDVVVFPIFSGQSKGVLLRLFFAIQDCSGPKLPNTFDVPRGANTRDASNSEAFRNADGSSTHTTTSTQNEH